ncbi:GGDEF domain-containing protein [Halomonas sp. BM-2019]|uniref:GGDEF domain-containing protein n=1 Tax=Halomonas sp. BM-2019 TaxID=2811227 RepID=UPI001B3C2B5E|nr:MAG: GGDEF domain-containing protein [Halomonas sp. BM-2019]
MTPSAVDGHELNWQAEFRDSALEALFQRTLLSYHACQLRLALGVIAALLLAFSLADYNLLGPGEAFLTLLAMRLMIVAVCLLLALAVWQRPAVAQWQLPINLVCLLGLSGLLLVIPLRPESSGIHVASIVVASMALYLFIPSRLPWMLAGNAYLFLGFVMSAMLWAPLPPGLMLTSLLLLLFVNLLGFVTITRIKRLKREQFALLLEERSANRRLKIEIRERAALETRLRHMACIDGLTGIANRRHFFELAEQELRRARRDGTPLAICMVDVDLFKQLNDRHGHAVGDLVLSSVASCCQSVLRESDVLGRYGGEEFVIALPLADLATAAAIGERLRDRVRALKLPVLGDETSLTVTVGISRVEEGESRLDHALLRADRALYAGKAQGRNCVVVASRPQQPGHSSADPPAWASSMMARCMNPPDGGVAPSEAGSLAPASAGEPPP